MSEGPCCKITMLGRAYDMINRGHTIDRNPQGRIENRAE